VSLVLWHLNLGLNNQPVLVWRHCKAQNHLDQFFITLGSTSPCLLHSPNSPSFTHLQQTLPSQPRTSCIARSTCTHDIPSAACQYSTIASTMSAEVSHGRGGAGNIGHDDTQYVDGEVVRSGLEGGHGDGAYSSGRGGKSSSTLVLHVTSFLRRLFPRSRTLSVSSPVLRRRINIYA
jgi:hypothetical protein